MMPPELTDEYCNSNPRCPLTLRSKGWLSVVPRKLAGMEVPALPVRDQVGLSKVKVLPLGVSVRFIPAAKVISSWSALSDFTTWPRAILGAVMLASWMALPLTPFAATLVAVPAVVALPAVVAVPAEGEKMA